MGMTVVGVRFIEPAMKTGRINPTPTLKGILYTKKVLSFELTTNLISFKEKEKDRVMFNRSKYTNKILPPPEKTPGIP